MRFKPCAAILSICCSLAGSCLAAQVDPNKTGGSQVKPGTTTKRPITQPTRNMGTPARPKRLDGVVPCAENQAPLPEHANLADWVADYVIGTELAKTGSNKEIYLDTNDRWCSVETLLAPGVKQEIASEVRAQIVQENSGVQPDRVVSNELSVGPSGLQHTFSDGNSHVFVANSALNVIDSAGTMCALSAGDILRLDAPPAHGSTAASLKVVTSKGSEECAQTDTVTVNVADLETMQAGLEEAVDKAIQELIAEKVKDQMFDVQTTGTIKIAVGQTTDQVLSALGHPYEVAFQGGKKTYLYPHLRVTFIDGKVTEVQ